MHGQVSWSVLRNRLPVGSDWLAKPPTNLVGAASDYPRVVVTVNVVGLAGPVPDWQWP